MLNSLSTGKDNLDSVAVLTSDFERKQKSSHAGNVIELRELENTGLGKSLLGPGFTYFGKSQNYSGINITDMI